MRAETDDISAEEVGDLLAELSLTFLLRLCPELEHLSAQENQRIYAAMHAKVDTAISGMLDDFLMNPNEKSHALSLGALTIAMAGVQELRCIIGSDVESTQPVKPITVKRQDLLH